MRELQEIIETEPQDCPFRNDSEYGHVCKIRGKENCEYWWNAYPVWCPLLSGEVTVKAIIHNGE